MQAQGIGVASSEEKRQFELLVVEFPQRRKFRLNHRGDGALGKLKALWGQMREQTAAALAALEHDHSLAFELVDGAVHRLLSYAHLHADIPLRDALFARKENGVQNAERALGDSERRRNVAIELVLLAPKTIERLVGARNIAWDRSAQRARSAHRVRVAQRACTCQPRFAWRGRVRRACRV